MTTDARPARTSRFMDHYSRTWWSAELLSTVLLAWPLFFAVLRRRLPPWISLALVTSLLCWVAFVEAERYSPRLATIALDLCSMLASTTVGTVGCLMTTERPADHGFLGCLGPGEVSP
ncbi:hypothetical protein [Actinopolyspora mortivallis]|uniref:hypothetical protein n=1 Tax=Actinopolyspora mortivallis TaxID=33906 RepID=UPI0003A19BBF|nr:hypothetical protein [Actinopolyspora mortivallis]